MVSKKAVVAVVCGALVVPGIAQATHHTGKLGAPGQVCKPLHQQQASDLQKFKSQDPAPTTEQVRTFRAMQHGAYKGCILQAAKARSQDKQQGQQNQTNRTPNVNSKGAPGQVCKPLREARKAQLEAFRNQDPKPSKELVREFKRTQRAAYKGCILGAAKARRQHNKQQHENQGKHNGKQNQA